MYVSNQISCGFVTVKDNGMIFFHPEILLPSIRKTEGWEHDRIGADYNNCLNNSWGNENNEIEWDKFLLLFVVLELEPGTLCIQAKACGQADPEKI